MPTVDEALAAAVQHYQAGRFEAAERLCGQVVTALPEHVAALHLLGLVASGLGRHNDAARNISRAIQLNGSDATFHSNLGAVFRAQGKLDESVASCRKALELKPNYAAAHFNLGSALHEQGQMDEAVACLRQALELRPDYAEARTNLGNALLAQGKLEEAAICFRRTLELKPDFPIAHHNLGLTFQAQGRLSEAIDCFRRALVLKPDLTAAHCKLGAALQAQGKSEEAAESYCSALGHQPDNVEANYGLAVALQGQGKMEEAVAACRRGMELNPDKAAAHHALGTALHAQGKVDQAIACFHRAVELNSDFVEAHSGLLFAMQFSPAYDAAALREAHVRFDRQHAAPLARLVEPHANDASPNRRLRVGYVSPNFRDHCQAFFTLGLFAWHDHQNFETFCYSDVARPDNVTERLRSLADVWRDTAGFSDEQVAQLVRQDQIDVLVDLTMHMAHNRLLVFARKPAPVQICWLAYPGTTGLGAIDYRLTDRYLDPIGLHDAYYSERSLRLPDTFWCYDPHEIEPEVNPLPASKNAHITFGSLNSFCKVNAEVLRLWSAVLKNVDGSRLILSANEGSHRQWALDLLAKEDISPTRITFVGILPRQRYLELYHGIDIGLDTFPYNGHTTSLDAYSMGVPVVTMVGRTVVGRAGLSQLSNLGLSELIAETPEHFVQTAVALANDLPRLSTLRATLRERFRRSPLTDSAGFARNIEAGYREVWLRWCGK